MDGTYSAEDLFTANYTSSPGFYHFYNNTPNPINYLYKTGSRKYPTVNNLTSVTLSDNQYDCSHLTGDENNTSVIKIKQNVKVINGKINEIKNLNNLSGIDSLRLDSLYMARHFMINSKIEQFLYNDSHSINLDSLQYLLEIDSMPYEYKILLSRLYLTKFDYTNAKTVVSDIINNQNLPSFLTAKLNRYYYLLDKIEKLYTSNDDWENLSQSDKDSIYFIANNYQDVYSSSLAQYLIERYDGSVRQTNYQNRFAQHQNIKQETSIIIYPNPTNHTLTIKRINDEIENEGVFEIYNNLGQVVKSGKIISSESIIDVFNLDKGIYIIKTIISDNKGKREINNKFIKL